jgi:arginine exporter protein ArgO
MTTANSATGRRTTVQTVARVVGIVFLIVGIAGFIPGLTSDMGSMKFAGHDSMSMLLGIFQVSILHNIVHLLFGIAGLVMSRTFGGARNYLIWGGVIYAILWIYGLVIANGSSANFVPLNTADNWLHFVLAVGMILLGVLLGRRDRAGTNTGAGRTGRTV